MGVCDKVPRAERLTDEEDVCERVGFPVLDIRAEGVFERLYRLDRVGSLVGNKETVGLAEGVIMRVGTGLLDGRITTPARCLRYAGSVRCKLQRRNPNDNSRRILEVLLERNPVAMSIFAVSKVRTIVIKKDVFTKSFLYAFLFLRFERNLFYSGRIRT